MSAWLDSTAPKLYGVHSRLDRALIPVGDLKPSIEASSMVFVFDSIDLQESSARAVGSQGSSNEIALRTPSGITFIEKTNTGNHVFTTVFSGSGNTSLAFHAVTSRHMEMMGVVVVSQWYGACEILPSQ